MGDLKSMLLNAVRKARLTGETPSVPQVQGKFVTETFDASKKGGKGGGGTCCGG